MPNEKVLSETIKKNAEENIEKYNYISPNFNDINCKYNLYNLY